MLGYDVLPDAALSRPRRTDQRGPLSPTTLAAGLQTGRPAIAPHGRAVLALQRSVGNCAATDTVGRLTIQRDPDSKRFDQAYCPKTRGGHDDAPTSVHQRLATALGIDPNDHTSWRAKGLRAFLTGFDDLECAAEDLTTWSWEKLEARVKNTLDFFLDLIDPSELARAKISDLVNPGGHATEEAELKILERETRRLLEKWAEEEKQRAEEEQQKIEKEEQRRISQEAWLKFLEEHKFIEILLHGVYEAGRLVRERNWDDFVPPPKPNNQQL